MMMTTMTMMMMMPTSDISSRTIQNRPIKGSFELRAGRSMEKIKEFIGEKLSM